MYLQLYMFSDLKMNKAFLICLCLIVILQVTMIKPAVGMEVFSRMEKKQFRNTMELRRKKRFFDGDADCPGGSYAECMEEQTDEDVCTDLCSK